MNNIKYLTRKLLFMLNQFKIFIIFVTLIILPSCQKTYYQCENNSLPLPEVCFDKREIGVALVLGGGGARGMFHVGVLEVLQEAKIPIDLIVGCSAGSIVGALYADQPDGQYVKDQLIALKRKDLVEFNLFKCRYGLCKGKALMRFLNNKLRAKNFEELKIPFLVVATDLQCGEIVTLGSGPIIPAVHASCAVPFFFEPVKLHGRILVDGGVLDPNPVASALKYSPKMIIAVDLTKLLPLTQPKNLFGVAARSVKIIHLSQSSRCLTGANVVIRPSLNPIGMFEDGHAWALYENGKQAARDVLPDILDYYEKHVHSPQL